MQIFDSGMQSFNNSFGWIGVGIGIFIMITFTICWPLYIRSQIHGVSFFRQAKQDFCLLTVKCKKLFKHNVQHSESIKIVSSPIEPSISKTKVKLSKISKKNVSKNKIRKQLK